MIKKAKEIVLTDIGKKTIGFFSSNKEYQFHGNRQDETERNMIEFNFADCRSLSCPVLGNYMVQKATGKDQDRLEVMRFLYGVIEEYSMPFDDNPDEPFISEYKK